MSFFANNFNTYDLSTIAIKVYIEDIENTKFKTCKIKTHKTQEYALLPNAVPPGSNQGVLRNPHSLKYSHKSPISI
jgi:hypothetical protein